MTLVAKFFLLPLLALSGVTKPSAQQPAAKAPASAPATTTYIDHDLHFTYSYASSLVADPETAKAAIEAEKKDSTGVKRAAADCVSTPLMAMDTNEGLRMDILIRMDLTCLGEEIKTDELGPAVGSILKESLARFGTPTLADPASYTLASSPAAAVSGSVASEKYGLTFYGSATCTLAGKNVLCWEFVSNDCAALAPMMAYPVTFDGKPATAVIPEKTILPCKL
jgi:hypothetical protein